MLPVARKSDMIAPGEPYLLLENLRIGRFLEVFADGEPPLLNCVPSGFALIEAPTVTATLTSNPPAAAAKGKSNDRQWWKFWR